LASFFGNIILAASTFKQLLSASSTSVGVSCVGAAVTQVSVINFLNSSRSELLFVIRIIFFRIQQADDRLAYLNCNLVVCFFESCPCKINNMAFAQSGLNYWLFQTFLPPLHMLRANNKTPPRLRRLFGFWGSSAIERWYEAMAQTSAWPCANGRIAR